MIGKLVETDVSGTLRTGVIMLAQIDSTNQNIEYIIIIKAPIGHADRGKLIVKNIGVSLIPMTRFNVVELGMEGFSTKAIVDAHNAPIIELLRDIEVFMDEYDLFPIASERLINLFSYITPTTVVVEEPPVNYEIAPPTNPVSDDTLQALTFLGALIGQTDAPTNPVESDINQTLTFTAAEI